MNQPWHTTFTALFERSLLAYRAGQRTAATLLTEADRSFLASIGHSGQEFFDWVEDGSSGSEITPTGALLVAAVRRDYFQVIQGGVPSTHIIDPNTLPTRSAAIDGISWLPRLLAKARAKLRGEMDPDVMYGCGGDRAFFAQHGVEAADLLRVVWAAGDDDMRVVNFIKNGHARA